MFPSSAARTAASRLATRVLVSSSSRAPSVAAASVAQQPSLMAVRYFASVSANEYVMSTFLPPAEVQERILTVVKNFDKVDPTKVTATSKFSEDLGLDSLDAVEMVMAIEDEFAIEIPDAEADRIASVSDAVEYVAGHPMAK
ncbi:hypothetical protein ACHAWU_005136 [Discostella pseudostelligera]|uniref:Acyl carrier protein n=1 Tax=Discostella pseudostelligera TaxID=259834 RepID=A0ABD3M074_9STRA